MDTTKLKYEIQNSNIPKDKKEYLISYIDNTNNSSLLNEEKARKINYAITALQSYLSEQELNSLSVILRDTFKVSITELTNPFGGIWNSLKFITNPVVLVILVLIIFFSWYYFKVLK